MENKKYEFTGETKLFKMSEFIEKRGSNDEGDFCYEEYEDEESITLYQIRALVDIDIVTDALHFYPLIRKGDIGGWIEKEENLSHEGNCWVAQDAIVCDDAIICDNALVYGNAVVRKMQLYKDIVKSMIMHLLKVVL